jgi:hypothetical protein
MQKVKTHTSLIHNFEDILDKKFYKTGFHLDEYTLESLIGSFYFWLLNIRALFKC